MSLDELRCLDTALKDSNVPKMSGNGCILWEEQTHWTRWLQGLDASDAFILTSEAGTVGNIGSKQWHWWLDDWMERIGKKKM